MPLVSGNIPLNLATGVFTLTANKTYIIDANLYAQNTVGSTNDFNVEWVDATSNAPLIAGMYGIGGVLTTGSFLRNYNPNCNILYTPTTNQTIKLRMTVFQITSVDFTSACRVRIVQVR